MSFIETETSTEQGKPVELFLFVYGPGDADRSYHTTFSKPVTYNGNTYEPLPIEREDINVSTTLDKQQLVVKVPADSKIAQQYQLYPPAIIVTLQVFRTHVGAGPNDVISVWSGRVLWCGFNDDYTANLECEPVITSLKRTGLQRHYQYICPYVLYDSRTCKADKISKRARGTVLSVSGRTVRLNVTSGSTASGNFRSRGAMFEWAVSGGRNYRTVQSLEVTGSPVSATEVVLSGPPTGLTTGMQVDLFSGCARTIDDCANLFGNVINFGGHPYIPLDNPLNKTQIFY